jgi:hypothetical protein
MSDTSAENKNQDYDSEMKEFVAKCCKPISREEQATIASYPQGSSSPEWLAARVGRLTGSVVGAVFGVNKYDSPDKRLHEMLFSEFKGNAATQYGNDNEKTGAARAFEDVMAHRVDGNEVDEHGFTLVDVSVKDLGLCVCRSKPFLAMSPDGIMHETWRREDHFGSHAGASAFLAGVLESAADINRGEAWLLEAGITFAEEAVVATVVKQKKVLVEYKCPYSKRNKGWSDAEDVYPLEQIKKATAPRPFDNSDASNDDDKEDEEDEEEDEEVEDEKEDKDSSGNASQDDVGDPLFLPMPSYYYAQVQYGMHILGVLDDMLTVPQTSYFVVWHPAYDYAKRGLDNNEAQKYTYTLPSSSSSSLSDAPPAKLWTASNAANTSTTYAGPYGTIQVTKVQYNKRYCKALMKCATEFCLQRLLPAIYRKSVGLLEHKPARPSEARHRRSKPIFMQLDEYFGATDLTNSKGATSLPGNTFGDDDNDDESNTMSLSLADLEAQFAVAGYSLEQKNDAVVGGRPSTFSASSRASSANTAATTTTTTTISVQPNTFPLLPSQTDQQRDQQQRNQQQRTKDMLKILNIM